MSILRADSIRDRAGTGAPDFPNGATVTGVVTATSFNGDGSALTGIDSSAIKDGSNVKVQATNTGATVTGTLVATVTGDVTGDLTGNADTATTATNAQGLTGTPDITVNNVTAGIVTATTVQATTYVGIPEGTNVLKAMLFA